jgi:hypothetical protein
MSAVNAADKACPFWTPIEISEMSFQSKGTSFVLSSIVHRTEHEWDPIRNVSFRSPKLRRQYTS